VDLYKTYDQDTEVILKSIENTLRYKHLEEHGPRVDTISAEHGLLEPYFTVVPPKNPADDQRQYTLANNGWIWGGDPMVDFASPLSKAYFRREVVAWGDSVKLRYGTSPVCLLFCVCLFLTYLEMIVVVPLFFFFFFSLG